MYKKFFLFICIMSCAVTMLTAQSKNERANNMSLLDAMNNSLNEILELSPSQLEQVTMLNGEAMKSLNLIRDKYSVESERANAATMIERKSWQVSTERDKSLLTILDESQKTLFIELVNESGIVFYNPINETFSHRSPKGIEEFIATEGKELYCPDSEKLVLQLHKF